MPATAIAALQLGGTWCPTGVIGYTATTNETGEDVLGWLAAIDARLSEPDSGRGTITGTVHGAMTGTMNDDGGEWLTISEAAARLGVRPVAIRRRIQRKTLRVRPAERENDGRTRVWITRAAGARTSDATGAVTGTCTGPDPVALLTEIAALRERIGRHEGTEAELRARLAENAAERDRLVRELADERQHGRDMAGQLDQAHRDRLADAKRHRTELDVLRADLAAERARPWLQRMWRW